MIEAEGFQVFAEAGDRAESIKNMFDKGIE